MVSEYIEEITLDYPIACLLSNFQFRFGKLGTRKEEDESLAQVLIHYLHSSKKTFS